MAHTQILHCSNGFNTDFAQCMHCIFPSLIPYCIARSYNADTRTPKKTHKPALLKAKQWIFQTTIRHVFSTHIRGNLLHCTAYVETDEFHTKKVKLKPIEFVGIDFHSIQFIHMKSNSRMLYFSQFPNMKRKYRDTLSLLKERYSNVKLQDVLIPVHALGLNYIMKTFIEKDRNTCKTSG